jgi:hypothetical protein
MLLDERSHEAFHGTFETLTVALLAIGVTLSLVCCSRQPEAARHTVAEYGADPALRREQFARCANDPGALGNTPDCVNVRQATVLEGNKSVRDLPPVRLPAPARPRE